MPADAGTAAYAVELLEATLGQAEGKRMFGGWGIYHQGVMVALVAFDELYLKVDDASREAFAAAGGRPFVYEGKGKPVTMNSYWTPPEEALEDPQSFAPWARLAAEAALRAPPKKKKR